MAMLAVKWFFPFFMGLLHPFYVSVTEVTHNAQDRSVEVTCKVFADDLEEVLRKGAKGGINLTDPSQQLQNNALVKAYFSSRLSLQPNGKAAALQYIGYEKEKESIYCYFELSNVASLQKLHVSTTILQDLNPAQINIIHATSGGVRRSTKLDFPAKDAVFSW